MLLSLNLVNWRSHENSVFEFKPGTNLFIGDMGSGKSTILDAISFCLFGTFPLLERKKLKLENLIRYKENSAKLILEFNWNGSLYRIERELKKSKNSFSTDAVIYKDNKLIEKGSTAVSSYTELVLQVDYSLFTRAIYSEQNNIDYFLTLDPRRRKTEFDTLLGLDKFETARANIITVINRLKSEKTSLESKFDPSYYERQKADLALRSSQSSELKKKLDLISHVLKDKESGILYLSEKFTKAKKVRDDYEKFSNEIIKAKTIVETLGTEVKTIEVDQDTINLLNADLSELEKEKQKIEFSLKNISNNENMLSREVAVLENKIKKSEQHKLELEKIGPIPDISLLISLRKEKEAKLISIQSDINSLSTQISEIESSIEKLAPGTSVCPVCDSVLDDTKTTHLKHNKKSVIIGLKKKIESLLTEKSTVSKEFNLLFFDISSIEKNTQRHEFLRAELSGSKELPVLIVTKTNELEKLKKSKSTVETDFIDLMGKLQKLKMSIVENGKLLLKKASYNEAVKKLSELDLLVNSLDFNQDEFESLRTSMENSRVDFEKTKAEFSSLAKECNLLGDLVVSIQNSINSLDGLKTDITLLQKHEEELTIYKNALIETQTRLRASLIEAINSAMNELWSIFYPYRDYSSLRLNATEKDYHFEVFDTEWKSLESVASGGERACAALALRVSLAMILTPNISWLILDEPTHNLDKNAVELLSQTLQYKVPEVVKQTFVITHDDSLAGSEFASSYRLVRNKAAFGSTVVEKI